VELFLFPAAACVGLFVLPADALAYIAGLHCSLALEVNASAMQRREPFPRGRMELKIQAAFPCINGMQASSFHYNYIVFIRALAGKLHGAYQYSIHREKALKKYSTKKQCARARW